jgi:hypothetical protein
MAVFHYLIIPTRPMDDEINSTLRARPIHLSQLALAMEQTNHADRMPYRAVEDL